MNCDYHIHSLPFSPDSGASSPLQAERAIALGMTEICLTEHLEVNLFPDPAWNMDTLAYYEYFRQLEFKGISVKLGVEAGITCKDEDVPALEEKLRAIPLDFVIASAHNLNGYLALDPQAYSAMTPEAVFPEYIRSILSGVRRISPSLYSCIGHIDFPARMLADLPDPRLRYSHAPDELDMLFRHLISQGKCIEVNTATHRSIGGGVSGMDWLSRYADLGGEFVTFGSDAHTSENVGYGLHDAAQIARAAGIKYFATYDRMEPILHRL